MPTLAASELFRPWEILGDFKDTARQHGLWNPLPAGRAGWRRALGVLDYAPIAELSGRSVATAPRR